MAFSRAKSKKMPELPFSHRLVLNQWLIDQCGYDALEVYEAERRGLARPASLATCLHDCPEGVGADNLHHFYHRLAREWPAKASVTPDNLLRYEQNIVSHSLSINARRPRPIIWKYYQWLSLLFVEIYLDRYFNQRQQLVASLNAYIERSERYWAIREYATSTIPYSEPELNKVCLQNATGSGKTLLMHVNFLQFQLYSQASGSKSELARAVLITPNEELSKQHQRELAASGINAKRLSVASGGVQNSVEPDGSQQQIDFTEITKLSDDDGPNQIAVRNLGDQNLLFVDEAHRGMGSKEERGWYRRRKRLARRGFIFEYSATFKEAAAASQNTKIDATYAKSILFDYSYRYFYEDGYGKDYRIFNLPQSYTELRFIYLSACLLAFYQQLKLYEDKQADYTPYNLEKPLWVFVGKSVSKATGSKDERQAVSDVALILQFIAHLLKDRQAAAATIEKILGGNGADTGLLDDTGHDIFAGSFLYIKDLLQHKSWSFEDLLRDIFSKVFGSATGGQLSLAKIKGDDSEIMLRVGQEETPFGLINVGDATGLLKHIEQAKIAQPDDFSNLQTLEAEFSDSLFGEVRDSSSPITLLLGSKKFVEGWDCWRVSTLGLMHVGKSEGAQIIQLFGRGVRLKGYDWTLKRSTSATPTYQPQYIQYLETLNIFGVQADFMDRFKKFLQDERLPGNSRKAVYTLPLNVTHDFGKELKVLRPRYKTSNGAEYDFQRDGKSLNLGERPKLPKLIEIDWYPRIQALESVGAKHDSNKNATTFSPENLAFLDYEDLFFKLEQFKQERAWHNLNFSKPQLQQLLADKTWYQLLVPAQNMTLDDFANVRLWRQMAEELLRKYCQELYNYSKAAFIEPRLELRPLRPDDSNLPDTAEYQLIVDSSEATLINHIQALTRDIAANKPGVLRQGDLRALLFAQHLYQPVLHTAKNSKIQIAPVSLNESEFQFVADLHDHLATNPGEQLYLLRNESRGKGIGFFEAGNFYPDFILWKIIGNRQCIAFIEPHGLLHEQPQHKKIPFHQTIKSIQERLADADVCLNSFVVTPTRFIKLNWGLGMEELEQMNVFFMQDQRDTYIKQILQRMEL